MSPISIFNNATALIALCGTLLLGCTPPKNMDFLTTGSLGSSKIENALPSAQWDNNPSGSLWTRYTLIAVTKHGSNLLSSTPADMQSYCPKYEKLNTQDRRSFWVHLISSLAKFESNHDPKVRFNETTVDPGMLTKQGEPIISRGLLQISKESANGYGCKITDELELHDPNTNINCAVRILDRWVGKDKVISGQQDGKWQGAARYFSPFRNPSKLSHMQSQSAKLPFCHI